MFNFFEKSDLNIQKDVINEILSDPSVSSDRLSVTAKDGVVTLRGSVAHEYEKSQVEAAAQRVRGVQAVADELEVNSMGASQRIDEHIAEAEHASRKSLGILAVENSVSIYEHKIN